MKKVDRSTASPEWLAKRAKQEICEKRYLEKNRDRKRAFQRKLEAKPENREKKRIRSAIYREKNRETLRSKFREYHSENKHEYNKRSAARRRVRRATCLQYKITHLMRGRLTAAIKAASAFKKSKTLDLVGCDAVFLINFIESKFLPAMTWKNHGLHGWHIDHIRPCSSFDLTDPEQQKQCFHYTNLQPLWALDNLSKNSKWIPYIELENEPKAIGHAQSTPSPSHGCAGTTREIILEG